MVLRRFLMLCVFTAVAAPAQSQDKRVAFEFKKGDRIAWVGSSSTNIGVWPKTMEFLLRTRHPELKLSFKKFSTGGGTFATGAQNLDKWLDEFKPTVVVLNYGGNDAGAGEKGISQYQENIAKCVAKIEAARARVLFTSFQGADVRKAGEEPAARRKIYAEAQLAFCKEKGWPIVDVFHPTTQLQILAQKDDDKFTILRDKIHLTDPAYIAWAYYLYDGLGLPEAVSNAAIDARLKTSTEIGCKVAEVEVNTDQSEVTFTRTDLVLPILPPGALPPRKHVPLEKHSRYLLRVTNLKDGDYEIRRDDKVLGVVRSQALSTGVNLNAVLLDGGLNAPWADLAKSAWAGNEIVPTKARWRIVRK